MDAFLNSHSCFTIVLPPPGIREVYHQDVAVQISRNLYQYYAADSEIVETFDDSTGQGNALFLDDSLAGGLADDFPISLHGGTLRVRDVVRNRTIEFSEPGLGAIFLHPLSRGRLGVVIKGNDELGLRRAMRLLPLRTGVGQPDLIVIGKEAGWRGLDGVRIMAMYTSEWRLEGGIFD